MTVSQQAVPVAGVEHSDPTALVWYFGYGSMVNPVSLQRRDIIPVRSLPAKLHGYQLIFMGVSGMANIQADPDSCTHGVLHQVTAAMFAKLAAIEGIYECIDVHCVPYDTNVQPITAKAFIIYSKSFIAPEVRQLPTERYIKIITLGQQHYQVDPDWIQHIASQPFKPSKRPEHYLRLPEPSDPSQLPVWTIEQVRQCKGQEPYIFALGTKVIEVDVSANSMAPYVKMMKEYFSGNEIGYTLCMNLYEPSLPELSCPEDLQAAHLAWAENFVMEMWETNGWELKQVGVLKA
eukprot:jgi/Chrzof1/14260/Cz08g31120.t1